MRAPSAILNYFFGAVIRRFTVGIVKIMASFPALVHSYYCVYMYINFAGSVSTLELEHVFDKGQCTENNQHSK